MSDRLDQAFRSLREAEDGHDPRAEETLARVLGDLRAARARPPVSRVARVWLLAAALVVVSSVAAARSASWVRVWRSFPWATSRLPPPAVGPSVGGALPARPMAPAAPSEPVSPLPPAAPDLAAAPVEGEIAARLPTADSAVPMSAPVARAAPVHAPVGARPPAPTSRPAPPPSARLAEGAAPSATSSSAHATLPSADDATFARAHRVHFGGGGPSAALAAWDDYLQRFPGGRFVPEAQYNRAIDLLKLGRNAEARDALAPFARGAYGDYRREEATAILRSMR